MRRCKCEGGASQADYRLGMSQPCGEGQGRLNFRQVAMTPTKLQSGAGAAVSTAALIVLMEPDRNVCSCILAGWAVSDIDVRGRG